ncbi:MAG: methanogenesis marker 17 protein [Methanosarcinales archaeon]|nr:MAG: methanogenesis marker 17 protein [Methanosarcinales archaeon]
MLHRDLKCADHKLYIPVYYLIYLHMEKLFIESEDKYAVEAYRQIVDYVLHDMSVKGLDAIHIYADPTALFFSCRVDFKRSGNPLKIRDLSTGRVGEEDVDLVIGEERYLAEMLRKLWDVYGQDRVEQSERQHIIVKGVSNDADVEKLLDVVVVDPLKSFYEQLITLAVDIIPVGFRVRRVEYAGDSVLVIASEKTIEKEWIDYSKEKLQWNS